MIENDEQLFKLFGREFLSRFAFLFFPKDDCHNYFDYDNKKLT